MTTEATAPPLAGIRVLALEGFVAGPYASMWLADMGAEVIKVEAPGSGDPARSLPPRRGDAEPRSLALLRANRNKKSVTLNLKDARGAEVFERARRPTFCSTTFGRMRCSGSASISRGCRESTRALSTRRSLASGTTTCCSALHELASVRRDRPGDVGIDVQAGARRSETGLPGLSR